MKSSLISFSLSLAVAILSTPTASGMPLYERTSAPTTASETRGTTSLSAGVDFFSLRLDEDTEVTTYGPGVGVRRSITNSLAGNLNIRQGYSLEGRTTSLFYAFDLGVSYAVTGAFHSEEHLIFHDGLRIIREQSKRPGGIRVSAGVTEYFLNAKDKTLMFFGGYLSVEYEYPLTDRFGIIAGVASDSASNGGSVIVPIRALVRGTMNL